MERVDDDISDNSVEEVGYHNMDYGDDEISEGSSTSSDDSPTPPLYPILLSIESPNLSALVTAFNATRTMNRVFANGGEDLVPSLSYDPEWYRKFAEPSQRPETKEDEWKLSLRVDLQVLSAFLDGKFTRSVASTGNLESLLRLRVSRPEEPQLEISTIFKLLVEIPQIYDRIMQFADVDFSRIAVLPIPIDTEDYWGTLQRAVDRVFWQMVYHSTAGTEPDVNQIPILDNLCDILVIQCQQPDIKPDEHIWPERYTTQYRDVVMAKWHEKHEAHNTMKSLEAELDSLSAVDGKPLSKALEITIDSLESAGLNSAASEIRDELLHLENESSLRMQKLTDLKRKLETIDRDDSMVPISPNEMTPYGLKALILMDVGAESNVVITRSTSEPSKWHFTRGSTTRIIDWAHVAYSAQRFDNYLAFYERETSSPDSPQTAPSIIDFAYQDSEHYAKQKHADSDNNSASDVDLSSNSDVNTGGSSLRETDAHEADMHESGVHETDIQEVSVHEASGAGVHEASVHQGGIQEHGTQVDSEHQPVAPKVYDLTGSTDAESP